MFSLLARLVGGVFTPLIDKASASTARLLRKLALFLVAALALVVVLIALTVAFDLWISSLYGSIIGALAVAGLYLAVALLCIFLAARPARTTRLREGETREQAEAEKVAEAQASGVNSQIDDFAAPLLNILQNLGLRREQLAVLAGASVAKQLGPVPLVGLAIVAGFLIGRMWGGWRGLLSNDLVATILSSGIFGSKAEEAAEDAKDEAA